VLGALADELAPSRPELKRYAVRTLLDVPRELARRGDATGGWLAPRCSADDREAFRQGGELSRMLGQAGCGTDLAVILDLPGPACVAAAAGMARRFDPVFTMDNLPHPAGVVDSAQTLAAAVYWRPEFIDARSARASIGQPAPALFLLEGNRLAPYANQSDRFDNRSHARLPDAAGFNALGVKRVLYVRRRSGEPEADDLNELFVALAAAGIEVRHLSLDTAAPAATATVASAPDRSPSHAAPQTWFWRNYGWYRPASEPAQEPYERDALYRTVQRPTMFSGARPVGFDGGERAHSAIVSALSTPPSGSWSRSSGSSWHSGWGS
jgi:hypothetical protein